ITVSRTKPGPSGSKNSVRRPAAAGSGCPLTSTVNGPVPPVTLSAIGSGLPEPSFASSSLALLGGNMIRSCGSAPSPASAPARKRCSGGGSLLAAATSVPLGAAGSGGSLLAAATSLPLGAAGSRARRLPVRAKAAHRISPPPGRGSGARRGRPPRHPGGVLPASPPAQGAAIPESGAVLKGVAPAGGVLRRRRAEKDAAHVPGGDRVQQPACRRRVLAAQRALRERHGGPEPRQPGIERNEIVERHPDAAEADGEPRHFAS